MSKTWPQRIDEAEKRGTFSREDMKDAGDWVTCACGSQDPRIPRHADGEPKDEELRELGLSFCVAVSTDGFDYARQLLGDIEARATFLISQIAPAAPTTANTDQLSIQTEGEE